MTQNCRVENQRTRWGRWALWLLVAVALTASAAAQPLALDDDKRPPRKAAERAAQQPEWPNPWLSFLPPEAEIDWAYWQARARIQGRERRLAMVQSPTALTTFAETEPNDTQATANFIAGFGTTPDEDPAVDVTGTVDQPPPSPLVPLPEDNGSIPLATPTGLVSGQAVRVSAVIGDGPYGSGGSFSGDFDFFAVNGVQAGQIIMIDVDTPIPYGDLDPFVALWNSGGVLIAYGDDDGMSYDSLLFVTAPADDDYYVSIGGYGSFYTINPFDSSSGFGPGSEGTYEVTIGLDCFEFDYFTVDLRKGDILGASILGGGGLELLDPGGTLRIGSLTDLSFVFPEASPLPGGGMSSLSYVIEEAGTYAVRVLGLSSGSYTVELRVFRNSLTSASVGDFQTLFLDFDGETINAVEIFGFGNNPAVLSPLSAFLPEWGLDATDEDAVIDGIVAAVEESLADDLRVKGNNGDFAGTGIPGEFDIQILNSRDHADPFGQPNVSRVIVGGTASELGFNTIGISQTIDPGNFETRETAVVLLEYLSYPASMGGPINSVPLAPGVSIIDLIGIAVGNVTAHEAGHFLGNFHTEQFVTPPNIMDQGGNLPGLFGIGADGIFGTADDIDVDLGFDVYTPNEGLRGNEDTLNTIAFGCSTPTSPTVIIDSCDSGVDNLFLADDTTISENVGECAADAVVHNEFVSCVSHFTNELKHAGILSGAQKGAITSCAGRSGIP